MPPSAPHFDTAAVRDYYERHTTGFLARGEGGALGTIRRGVWAPGVTSPTDAFHYVDDRIGAVLDTIGPAGDRLRVVDLGCGVGASLCRLAARRPLEGVGLTLSPAQAAEGRRRLADAGLADRVQCIVGDFCDPPRAIAPADAAWAIEAFAHAPAAAPFFAGAARVVRPGGALLVCDDFAGPAATPSAEATRARVRRGWHLNTLVTLDAARAAGAAAGFALEETVALTPWLRLDRPRDRGLALLAGVLDPIPAAWRRWGPLLGGNALRRALQRGWIGYHLLRFRRSAKAS